MTWALCATPAHANKFLIGDAEVKFGGVISAGTSVRTRSPDASLIPATNAAAAGVPGFAPAGRNQDDGNLNYRKGDAVSTVVKALANLEITRGAFGAHLSAMAWRDFALTDGNRPWGNIPNNFTPGVPLGETSDNSYGKFSGAALLDANVYGTVNAGNFPLYAKAGNQRLPWGIPSTIAGGLSILTPINQPASRRPGVVLDEVAIPVPALFTRIGLTPTVNFEAFYQFAFQRTELLGCGTFYSTIDYVADRCDKVMLGAGLNDRTAIATGNFAKRAPDRDPSDSNQFGAGLTYNMESIGTQFGAYFSQYHSRTQYISVIKSGRADPFIAGDPDGLNARYFIDYPERIQMFGFNAIARWSETTLSAEVVYRPNQPLQLNGTDITNVAVSNTAPTLLRAQYAAIAPGGIFTAYDRFNTTDVLLGATRSVSGVLGAQTLTLGADAGLKVVHDLPDVNFRRYGRADVFGSPPFLGTCPTGGVTGVSCSNDGFVTSTAFGGRVRAALTYPNVMAGADLIPSVSYGYDIKGWSYDGIFNEGRQFAVFGLRSEFRNRYAAELAYVKVWGGAYNNARDRDALTVAGSARF